MANTAVSPRNLANDSEAHHHNDTATDFDTFEVIYFDGTFHPVAPVMMKVEQNISKLPAELLTIILSFVLALRTQVIRFKYRGGDKCARESNSYIDGQILRTCKYFFEQGLPLLYSNVFEFDHLDALQAFIKDGSSRALFIRRIRINNLLPRKPIDEWLGPLQRFTQLRSLGVPLGTLFRQRRAHGPIAQFLVKASNSSILKIAKDLLPNISKLDQTVAAQSDKKKQKKVEVRTQVQGALYILNGITSMFSFDGCSQWDTKKRNTFKGKFIEAIVKVLDKEIDDDLRDGFKRCAKHNKDQIIINFEDYTSPLPPPILGFWRGCYRSIGSTILADCALNGTFKIKYQHYRRQIMPAYALEDEDFPFLTGFPTTVQPNPAMKQVSPLVTLKTLVRSLEAQDEVFKKALKANQPLPVLFGPITGRSAHFWVSSDTPIPRHTYCDGHKELIAALKVSPADMYFEISFISLIHRRREVMTFNVPSLTTGLIYGDVTQCKVIPCLDYCNHACCLMFERLEVLEKKGVVCQVSHRYMWGCP